MGNKKKNKCIDFNPQTESYGFTEFNKYFKNGRTYRKHVSDLTKEELNLLHDAFTNHWNGLPIKLKNRFIKWLTSESNKLYPKPKKSNNNP